MKTNKYIVYIFNFSSFIAHPVASHTTNFALMKNWLKCTTTYGSTTGFAPDVRFVSLAERLPVSSSSALNATIHITQSVSIELAVDFFIHLTDLG